MGIDQAQTGPVGALFNVITRHLESPDVAQDPADEVPREGVVVGGDGAVGLDLQAPAFQLGKSEQTGVSLHHIRKKNIITFLRLLVTNSRGP